MKKSPNKFALRNETLRVLLTKELVLAAGGDNVAEAAANTNVKVCGGSQIN